MSVRALGPVINVTAGGPTWRDRVYCFCRFTLESPRCILLSTLMLAQKNLYTDGIHIWKGLGGGEVVIFDVTSRRAVLLRRDSPSVFFYFRLLWFNCSFVFYEPHNSNYYRRHKMIRWCQANQKSSWIVFIGSVETFMKTNLRENWSSVLTL